MTSSAPDRRRFSPLSSIPIVTIGLLVVTLAIVRVPWPPDQPPVTRYGITVSFVERLQGVQIGLPENAPDAVSGRGSAWTIRRMLDACALLSLVIGYMSVGLLFWLDTPYLLVNLVIIGGYGAIYGGSVGLQPGPLLATAGFGLVFCSAGLTLVGQWASTQKQTLTPHDGTPSVNALSTGSDEL
jgi:hypothetical protein